MAELLDYYLYMSGNIFSISFLLPTIHLAMVAVLLLLVLLFLEHGGEASTDYLRQQQSK